MKTRLLGKNLKVSVLGFGGAAVSSDEGGYGFGHIPEGQAQELLQYAYEKGVTLFDTAPIYGFGTSEKRIGKALSGNSSIRKNITLVSKLGATWDENRTRFLNNSPEVVKKMLVQSLVDLKTDYLDLYMVHWPDAHNPIEKTMEALLKAKQDGLICNIGVCNFNEGLLQRALNVGDVDVVQNPFSLIDTLPKKELFPILKEKRIGFMSYGTLAKGMLTGSVKKDRVYDPTDVRYLRGKSFEDQYLSISPVLDKFYDIASGLGVTPAQLALAWVLAHDEVGVALCGAKTMGQLDNLIEKVDFSLSDEMKKTLDDLSIEFSSRIKR